MEHPLTTYLRETKTPLAELADKLGVQPPAISKWSRRGVPAERVPALSDATGIPRHTLRPDLYAEPAA